MGAYQINVGFGVTGAEQLDRGNTALDRTADRTKRVDEAIKGYVATNEKLNGKLVEVERQELRLESLREKHRMQTERLAASTDKQTVSQERLNGAMRSHVSDVQAASGAIRAFEGTLPIRAVEQFTTKVLGMGGALQAIFPIVGAVALIEVLGQGIHRLDEMYDKYILLKDVQDEMVKGARELAGEYENAARKLDQHLIQSLRDQKRYREAAQIETRGIESASIRLPELDKAKLGQLNSYQQQQILGAYSEIIPADIPRRISEIENRLHTINLDLENYAAGGPVRINAPSQRQAELEKQFYENLLPVLGIERQRATAEGQAAQGRAAKDEQREATRLAQERQRIEEHILAIRKKAEEAAIKAYFGNSLEGKAAYDQVRLGMEEADEIRKNPANANRIRGYYTVLRTSAYGENAGAIAKRDSAEAYALDDISQSATTHLYRQLQGGEKDAVSALREILDNPYAPAPPTGYRSAQRELRSVRESERRYMSVARIGAQLSGQSELDQAQGQYGARLRFAEQEYQAELRLADLKKTQSEKDVARADALDQKNQAIFDAQMEREKAILEMILRQKQEFERNFVNVIHAAASGHLGAYVLGQLEKLGDQILAKMAGKIFDRIFKPNGVSIPDVLGGAAKDSPIVTTTEDNTRATDDLTHAVRDLTSVIVSHGVGGGGFGVGGGGVGTIGFPNGSGGPGVMGGASSTIMYGFPGAGGGSTGTMSAIGRIGAYAGAGLLGYEGIRTMARGGGRNVSAGIGELAMGAALVDPEPISKAILAGVGVVAGVVSSLFGDPKAERQRDINNRLSWSRYMDPVAIHASMTTGGGYADYDRFGGIRGSELSPYPFIQPGYRDPFNNNAPVPGRTVGQFGNGPTIIYAMDGQDVKRVLTRHSDALGDAVVHILDRGHTALQERLHG